MRLGDKIRTLNKSYPAKVHSIIYTKRVTNIPERSATNDFMDELNAAREDF